MRDATARRLSTIHALAFRATGGRIGRRLVNNDMLLLSTTGRRTGRIHTIPLLYLRDGDDVIVIASWGGRDYSPHWFLNVVANPRVGVQIDGNRYEGTTELLEEPERSLWWQRAVTAHPGYEKYQARTDRTIPIVRLRLQAAD